MSKCDKVFFPTKKRCISQKKLQFFSLRKGNLWRKILLYFFESSNWQFWENSPWNKLVRFWVGWIIYLVIFLIWWHPAEKIINFSIHYICVCVCVYGLLKFNANNNYWWTWAMCYYALPVMVMIAHTERKLKARRDNKIQWDQGKKK